MEPGWSIEWRKFGDDTSWIDEDVKEETSWGVILDMVTRRRYATEWRRYEDDEGRIYRQSVLIPCKI